MQLLLLVRLELIIDYMSTVNNEMDIIYYSVIVLISVIWLLRAASSLLREAHYIIGPTHHVLRQLPLNFLVIFAQNTFSPTRNVTSGNCIGGVIMDEQFQIGGIQHDIKSF